MSSTKGSERMYVTFWGTRGSISTPGASTEKYGGNTPCVSVRYRDTQAILDSGTGIRNLGLKLAEQLRETRRKITLHLLLSHTHWDHIQGLPFFKPAYMDGVNLVVYGSPKKGEFLESILRRQMDVNYFPVEMNALAASISINEIFEKRLTVGAMDVDWEEQVFHPGGCLRYRLRAGDRKVVYSTDVELDKMFRGANGFEPVLPEAKRFGEFIQDADLLIADGQYTEEEYSAHAGYGHSSVPVVIEAACRHRVKRLAVFHHDPEHSDAFLDALSAKYREEYADREHKMSLSWACEGTEIEV